MKTRQGFVSNSSTSSFVIIGYRMPDDGISDEELEEMQDNGTIHYIEDYGYIRGAAIAHWDDEGGDIEEIPLSTLVKAAEKICKETGTDLGEIKLFCGICAS